MKPEPCHNACMNSLPDQFADADSSARECSSATQDCAEHRARGVHHQGMLITQERAKMFAVLDRLADEPVVAYVWAFKGIYPALVLTTSFVLSQVLHELLLYEISEAFAIRSAIRAVFEVVAPLTLWFLVDMALQFALAVCGRGHRVIAQLEGGRLLVFHRQLLSTRPERLEHDVVGSLAMTRAGMGYAIDRLDTPAGRFYVWGRWRDLRMLLTPPPACGSAACALDTKHTHGLTAR